MFHKILRRYGIAATISALTLISIFLSVAVTLGIDFFLELEGLDVQPTFSMGIATFACTMDNLDDLLKEADLALFQAKRVEEISSCWHEGKEG